MAYELRLLDEAVTRLAKITLRDRRVVWNRILRLGEDPWGPGTGRLGHDLRGYRKLRAGDHRAVYEVLADGVTVEIVAVGHRKHVYGRALRSLE